MTITPTRDECPKKKEEALRCSVEKKSEPPVSSQHFSLKKKKLDFPVTCMRDIHDVRCASARGDGCHGACGAAWCLGMANRS